MFLAGEAGFTLEVVLFLPLKLKYLQKRMIPSKLELTVSDLTGVVYILLDFLLSVGLKKKAQL